MDQILTEMKNIQERLVEAVTKLSFIEHRLYAAESRTGDLLRHAQTHLREYSFEAAHGDSAILEGWLISLQSQFYKACLSIGLPETQISEMLRVLLGSVERKLRVDSDCAEMSALLKVLSSEIAAERAEWISEYTQTIQYSELAKRNLSLPCWVKLRLTEEQLGNWSPQTGFSGYLTLQAAEARASLVKVSGLRVRLAEELRVRRIQKPSQSLEMETLRADVAAQLLRTENEAQRRGAEVAQVARI